jgi:hypothetical protein
MRALLALILVFGLSGCTDRERSHLDAFFGANSPFSDDPPAPSAPIPAQLNPKCREVAFNRSSDVRSQGFDGNVARAVYNSVYSDCTAWAQRGSDLR